MDIPSPGEVSNSAETPENMALVNTAAYSERPPTRPVMAITRAGLLSCLDRARILGGSLR
jgi:hypothetical protein